MTKFGVKWPEKGLYAVKQTNQPTNQPTIQPINQSFSNRTIWPISNAKLETVVKGDSMASPS